MIWLKSAILIPSSGCISAPRTDDPTRLNDASRNSPRIVEDRSTVDIESGERTRGSPRILVIKIIEAPLIRRANRDELHALSPAFNFAGSYGGLGLFRQRRLPYRNRGLQYRPLLRG